MDFLHPLALLAILPLGWMIYHAGRRRLRRLPWLRALTTLLLRLLIASLLLIALAGPRVSYAASGVHVVFVLDQSSSMGSEGRQAAQAWIRAALEGRHADDTASLVAFGGSPAWTGAIPSTTLPPIPAVDADGTDIDAAIRLASAGLPADQSSRLVLLSDGRQTAGDALQAAQQAASAGVPVSVVPIIPPTGDDVAVASVDVPHSAHSGENITLRIGLHADHPATVQVRLSVDGTALGERSLALQTGLNSFFFAQVAGQPGIHDYRVQVVAPNDPVPQNDTLDAVTVVGPAPRLLVIAGNPADATPLIRTLTGAGFGVRVLPAAQAPTDAAALDAYDAVVLADVPASALSKPAVSALRASVHDDGHGLLVTGGAHSFAVGGYSTSNLEELLPVTSLAMAHAGHGDVGLILIIDKSGSMMDEVQGVSKISMAQQASIEAVAHLQPTDSFGILAFDDTTHVIVPYGPVGASAQARIRSAVLNIEPFGDTVIYPALRQAARYLFASHAPFKHVVLMTDGQGETAPFLKLIKLMRQNNITLSTIAIGTDAEVDELRSFANAGGGRFYYVADPHDIPRLVVLETRISSGPTRVQGTIGVRQAANSPALRSLVGQRLPSLRAYNITTARATAQVPLQSQLGDPLFAQWQFGLGRVAAWTGGTAADWSGSWIDQRTFWSDAVHGILPASSPQLLRPDLQQADGALQIGADAVTPQGGFANLLTTRALVTSPDGQTRSIALAQDAPGHYAATLPPPGPGAYRVTLAQYDGATLLRQATGAIAIPYPAEYAPAAPNLPLLSDIAGVGNAPTLSRPADAFSSAGLPAHPVKREVWPALALLALLLFPLDVALRVLYTPPVPYDPERFAPPTE